MFNRSPQHDARGDRRAPRASARQAAEALFAPKPERVALITQEAVSTDEAVRKPRVLAVAAATPVEHNEPEEPIATPATKPAIPAAHIARIRAGLKYGMTRAQVAEIYGVAVGEVARLLRTA